MQFSLRFDSVIGWWAKVSSTTKLFHDIRYSEIVRIFCIIVKLFMKGA